MRLIYVPSSLPYGLEEAFIIPEIEELAGQGHKVIIVPMYPRGPVLHDDAKALMEHTVAWPVLSPGIVKAAIVESLRAPTKVFGVLGWLFQSRSLMILLKNLAVYPKGLWLGRLAREWKADHIHAHWAATTATMALIASEVSDVPWSLTAHRWDIAENNLLDLKAKRACFVRAIDIRGAQELESCISSERPRPLVIHMGVATPPVTNQGPMASKPTFRIVVAARLVEKKGHIYLFEAVRLLSIRNVPVSVDLAGDGPLREELTRKAMALGLTKQVTFLGPLSHRRLLKQIETGRWDTLVLPSITTASGEKEGIPVSLTEAMARGIPVVSTTTGGIPELLEGGAGLLVPPEDPGALADAIERLVKDPELRQQLGEAGRKRVEDSFAVESAVAELVRRFEACFNSSSGNPWS